MTSFLATKGQTTLLKEQVNAHSQRRLDRRISQKKKRNARKSALHQRRATAWFLRGAETLANCIDEQASAKCQKYLEDADTSSIEVTQRRNVLRAVVTASAVLRKHRSAATKEAHNFAQKHESKTLARIS